MFCFPYPFVFPEFNVFCLCTLIKYIIECWSIKVIFRKCDSFCLLSSQKCELCNFSISQMQHILKHCQGSLVYYQGLYKMNCTLSVDFASSFWLVFICEGFRSTSSIFIYYQLLNLQGKSTFRIFKNMACILG